MGQRPPQENQEFQRMFCQQRPVYVLAWENGEHFVAFENPSELVRQDMRGKNSKLARYPLIYDANESILAI